MGTTETPTIESELTGKTTYHQASFRLTPDTIEAIREYAVANNCSQSEAMRSAVALLKHNQDLPDNVKLATVDLNENNGTDYYKVVSWIISE